MARKVFVVMGATGKVGGVVAEALRRMGHSIKVMGRNPERLNAFKAEGMQVAGSTFSDAEGLKRAFRSCDGVFAMIPPSFQEPDFAVYQDRVGSAVSRALLEARVKTAVFLSSIGADKSSGHGPIAGLHRQEGRLKSITGLQTLFLRSAYFMENFFGAIPVIKSMGVLGTPLRGDLKMRMVATQDIGTKAAEFLDQARFNSGDVFELGGPCELTPVEVTAKIGKAIGKPDLAYRQFSYEEARKGMLAASMKPSMVDLTIEMIQALNEERLEPTQKIEGLHRGKTAFESLLPAFKAAYEAP